MARRPTRSAARSPGTRACAFTFTISGCGFSPRSHGEHGEEIEHPEGNYRGGAGGGAGDARGDDQCEGGGWTDRNCERLHVSVEWGHYRGDQFGDDDVEFSAYDCETGIDHQCERGNGDYHQYQRRRG